MEKEEYFGILSSPRAPRQQKQRALRKIERTIRFALYSPIQETFRFEIKPNTPFGNEEFGHISIVISDADGKLIDFQGDTYVYLKMNDDYSVSVITPSGEEVFRGSYRDAKKYIQKIRKSVYQKAVELKNSVEPVKVPIPSWTKALLEDEILDFRFVHVYDINIRLFPELSVTISPVSVILKGALTYIEFSPSGEVGWYPESTEKYVKEAVAKTHGLCYLTKPRYNERFKFYSFLTPQKKVPRTKRLSPVDLYRVHHETEKSIWLSPVTEEEFNRLIKT